MATNKNQLRLQTIKERLEQTERDVSSNLPTDIRGDRSRIVGRALEGSAFQVRGLPTRVVPGTNMTGFQLGQDKLRKQLAELKQAGIDVNVPTLQGLFGGSAPGAIQPKPSVSGLTPPAQGGPVPVTGPVTPQGENITALQASGTITPEQAAEARALLSRSGRLPGEEVSDFAGRLDQVAGAAGQPTPGVGTSDAARPRPSVTDPQLPEIPSAPPLITDDDLSQAAVSKQEIETINREEGTTILLVEQNANLALQAASRGYVVETGEITLEDDADALMANPKIREAYLGE